jgi:hypothetical protein
MPDKRKEKILLTPAGLAARHRRQVQLHILLPLVFSILLVLAVAGLAIAGTVNRSSEVNRWGNISAVLLLIPNLLTSLLSIGLLLLIVRGVNALYRKIPGWLVIVLGLLRKIHAYVRSFADKIATPVVSINSTGAGFKAARKGIFRQPKLR